MFNSSPTAEPVGELDAGRQRAIAAGVGDKVTLVRDKLADARNIVQDRYLVVSESTDDFVHESP